jgi:FKBP-type peptidyl-prolyl cis-trans isomerase
MVQRNFNPPVVNLYSHVDSLEQLQIDKSLITQAIAENKTDAKQEHLGIYYTILNEGNGRQVSVNDTVVAYYKGSLLEDNLVFDETKDKPATFPLKRLIMGWQIGVPLCKVGGKIKIIIPSNLAYSIRTRAAKIPPNSILVFEIEVVDARAPVN